jgi:hypothetical protein
MLHGMTTDTMNPATAVTWGPFIQAAYEQFVSNPGEVNPPAIKNMPALLRHLQHARHHGLRPAAEHSGAGRLRRRGRTRGRGRVGRRSRPWPADGDLRPQPGWRAGDAPGRGRDREHAAQAAGLDLASPQVGDAIFAARYGGLTTVSWRIYNQVDVVPYFPVDAFDNYQPVTAGYAINSLGKAHWSLGCAHALNTYLHVLSPATVPLDPACKPA